MMWIRFARAKYRASASCGLGFLGEALKHHGDGAERLALTSSRGHTKV